MPSDPIAASQSNDGSAQRRAKAHPAELAGAVEPVDFAGQGTGSSPAAVANVVAEDTPAAAASAVPEDVEPIIDAWREEQSATGGSGPGPRFVLNFATAVEDSSIEARIGAALRLTVEVRPLFEPEPDLDRFRRLVIPGTSRADRSDMFEVARFLRNLTGAETVDPDLGTDYFDWDRPPPPPAAPESADFAFWCWAHDQPTDPDWAINRTSIAEAWDYSATSSRPGQGDGIRVFQPDTGVVPTHPELPRDVDRNAGAFNLVEAGRPPVDPMQRGMNPGHGTGTASVVASPLGGRMRGTAPRATLVPIRCIESVAVFDQSPVAQAIDHARRNGAHVITMSLGGVFSEALHAALRKAVDANVIVVAAAGNCVGQVVWPARYDEAIAVGGVNEKFEPWRGSSRGPNIAISGPAEFVLRADPRVANDPGAVSGGQGTSFATAHLAGIAALWLAHHGRNRLIALLPPGLRLQQVFRTLVQITASAGRFEPDQYGAGVVNALALLKQDVRAAFGHETAFASPITDIRRQVAALVAESSGGGDLEATAPALGDKQNLAEIACVALDRLRSGRTRRARVEALPPRSLSPGLRRVLAGQTGSLNNPGGRNAQR